MAYKVDSSDLTVSSLKQIIGLLCYTATGKGGRCVIINESHGLRKDVVRQLLVELERLPKKAAIVFTTTNEGRLLFDDKDDSSPLLSRCVQIRLTSQGLAPLFAKRAKEIAMTENMDGQPIDKYLAPAKKCRNNMRDMLTRIESGELLES